MSAPQFDYLIVGAGSAGCVLANRLSADPRVTVLLLEAGPPDRHPLIRMPKGSVRLFGDPRLVWQFPIEPPAPGVQPAQAIWVRGRTLGGSSAINGMMYVRGQPEDYDDWERLGNAGWGWRHMAPCFKRMEDHELGEDDLRGAGGPLRVSCRPRTYPLADAIIEAGVQMGLTARDDLNRLDQEGVGYYQMTVRNGRRESAADAFLRPAMARPNLSVLTGHVVGRVLVEGARAAGVVVSRGDAEIEFRAGREVILSAGAIASPAILQRSGIGPARHLKSLGIPVHRDLPGVGANMREHPVQAMQFRLNRQAGHNRDLRGLRLIRTALAYYLFRRNVLATCGYEVGAFAKTDAGMSRPDIQLHMALCSLAAQGGVYRAEVEPGFHCIGNPMRPESRGTIMLRSADPRDPPVVTPNYLTAAYDRHVMVEMVRYIRRYFDQPAIRPHISAETFPGPAVNTADEIVDCYLRYGQSGFHAAGTCKMGIDAEAVVDPALRVRGVAALRVVDCSVMPALVSGNTNGPAMAVAWRASEIIAQR